MYWEIYNCVNNKFYVPSGGFSTESIGRIDFNCFGLDDVGSFADPVFFFL